MSCRSLGKTLGKTRPCSRMVLSAVLFCQGLKSAQVASATLDAALAVSIQRMKIRLGSDRDAGTRDRSGVAAVTEKKMSVCL